MNSEKLKPLLILWTFMGGLVAAVGAVVCVVVKAAEHVVVSTTDNIFKD